MKEMQIGMKVKYTVLGVAAMGIAWAYYSAPSERILPMAENLAESALNTNKLELILCDLVREAKGNEVVAKYDGKNFLVTVGEDGTPVFEPYEASIYRCN